LIHEFIRNRSRGFATRQLSLPNNANVLHYIENNQQCKAGDLILLDVAAEYANYSICRVPFRFQAATLRDKRSLQCRAECQNEATKC
jgi:Xaa-Pro aminopeptidase